MEMVICGACKHRYSCLVEPLLDTKLYSAFQAAISSEYTVDEGQYIFKQGEYSGSLYLLKSGSIKMTMTMVNGSKKVLGFGFAWRLIGVASAVSNVHVYSAIALEKVRVCRLDFQKVSEIMFLNADFHKKFLTLLMAQMIEDTRYDTLIACGSVEQRTASFLYSQVMYSKKNGMSDTEIYLPMPRSDISEFLNVSVESLSRGLTSLVKKRVIVVHNRRVIIVDAERLQGIAEGIKNNVSLPENFAAHVPSLRQVELFSK